MTFFQMVCEFNIWSGLAGQGHMINRIGGDGLRRRDPAHRRTDQTVMICIQ
jgi:hypothetical protein